MAVVKKVLYSISYFHSTPNFEVLLIHLYSQNLRNSGISGFHFILDKRNFVPVVAEGGYRIHLRILHHFLDSIGASH